jgi:hypothetical protein
MGESKAKCQGQGNYPLTVGKENPYVDYRLGGIARYFFPPREDIDMRVPDEILKCVVFLGVDHGAETKYVGTAFFVQMEEKENEGTFRFTYLITANHVAEALEGVPFKIRVNTKAGDFKEIQANESGNLKWYQHRLGKIVDVAACSWEFPSRDLDALAFGTNVFLTDDKPESKLIGVGDEVLITGLFTLVTGKSRNIPIVRIGNLSMSPREAIVPTKLGDIEAYIIEARSIGGLSGSPVFIRQTIDLHGAFKWGTNIPSTLHTYSNAIHFLGLVHGHWDIEAAKINDPTIEPQEEGINMGLAIVVPASQILELLNGRELSALRQQTKDKARSKRHVSTMDSAATEKAFTKDDFEHALKKASRKITPAKS